MEPIHGHAFVADSVSDSEVPLRRLGRRLGMSPASGGRRSCSGDTPQVLGRALVSIDKLGNKSVDNPGGTR